MEKIKLNKEFYSLEAVNQAIEDFKEAASIKSKDEGRYHSIEIVKKENHPFLKEEFANYALGISKNKKIL